MMSQQQNQSSVSQSLLQQTISGADAKPFSIRQYVHASRHRNILHNWPFHEKHLQLCFKHGLKEVLPPLEELLKGCSNLMHSPNDNNKDADSFKADVPHLIDDDNPKGTNYECVYKVTNHPSSHEEANQNNYRISNKAVKNKRKRRKGRRKKRSMVDILAVAAHSTLEEIHRMNKFYYAETVIHEKCQHPENISRSEVVGNVDDMAPKGPLLLKFKLNGCNVNRNSGA